MEQQDKSVQEDKLIIAERMATFRSAWPSRAWGRAIRALEEGLYPDPSPWSEWPERVNQQREFKKIAYKIYEGSS